MYSNTLTHHGVDGQKWGVRRYQNKDGSYKSGAEGRYDPEPSGKEKSGPRRLTIKNSSIVGPNGVVISKETKTAEKKTYSQSGSNSSKETPTPRQLTIKSKKIIGPNGEVISNEPIAATKTTLSDAKKASNQNLSPNGTVLSNEPQPATKKTTSSEKSISGSSSTSSSSKIPEGSVRFKTSYDEESEEGVLAPWREEGYSEEDLKAMGNKPKGDGGYEGYYKAPNGKWYPVSAKHSLYSRYELCHHGILGMKWGIRRYQNPDGTLTAEGKKRYERDVSKNHQKSKKNRVDDADLNDPDRWVEEDLTNAKDITSSGKSMTKALQNLEKDTRPEPQIERLDLSNMTDKELRDAINRELLERQYNDIFNKPNVDRGRENVNKVLAVTGDVLEVTGSALGIAVLIKKLMS